MNRCPNCDRRTARTKDWACQWCGYPLISNSYKVIPKTYKELKEERRLEEEPSIREKSEVSSLDVPSPLPPTPLLELEPEPESKLKSMPEPKLEPAAEAEKAVTAAMEAADAAKGASTEAAAKAEEASVKTAEATQAAVKASKETTDAATHSAEEAALRAELAAMKAADTARGAKYATEEAVSIAKEASARATEAAEAAVKAPMEAAAVKVRLAETQVTECVSNITQNNQTKMSTLKGRPKTYRKRALPEELITQLSAEGLGAKAIATQLKKQGVVVSYRTILRFLNGQGNG